MTKRNEKMPRFHVIEEGVAVIIARGVYRQVKVFRRGGDVYAAYGAGYLKLFGFRGTSHPKISWIDIEADGVKLAKNNGTPVWEGE